VNLLAIVAIRDRLRDGITCGNNGPVDLSRSTDTESEIEGGLKLLEQCGTTELMVGVEVLREAPLYPAKSSHITSL
jgi:hypothetical protein